MSNKKLQISNGTKRNAQILIDKIYALYQHFSWVPVYDPTDDFDQELRGYKVLFDGTTVEIRPLWWGTWVKQYKDGHYKDGHTEYLNYFAVHTGHQLYSKIKTVQEFAARQVKKTV